MPQTIATRLPLSKLNSSRPRNLTNFLAFAILCLIGVLPLQAQENWTGWSSLGQSLASDPAVARNSDGRLEVFFGGSDSLMYHAKQVSPGSEAFDPFTTLEDRKDGNPVMVRDANDRLWVFVRGGNVLFYKFQQGAPGGEWSRWEQFPTGELLGDPSVVVFQGRLHVFFRGRDNRVYYYAQWVQGDYSSTNWSGWVSLDGAITANPVAVASDPNTRLEVFVRGTTGGIYTRSWAGTWSGWSAVANNIGGSGAPAAASDGFNVEVVARGSDQRTWRIARSIGGSWPASWTYLGGPASASNPTLAVNDDRRMEIFIVGSDGNVYHNSEGFPGGSFTGFNSLGGFPGAGADIHVALNSDRRLQIFVRNGVNGLDERSQASPGGI